VTDAEKLRHLEDRLWKAADQLRANSSLPASQYSIPVLGLIFLRYADVRFTQVETQLAGKATGRRDVGKTDYQAKGVMYVPDTARFSYLQALPKGTDIGQALNRAMEAIEIENPDLRGVLPHDYSRLGSAVLAELLRSTERESPVPEDVSIRTG
jgi:type I restriction enzyme M protein